MLSQMKQSIPSTARLSHLHVSGGEKESTAFSLKLGTTMVRIKVCIFGRERDTDSRLEPHRPPRKHQVASVRRLASATPSNKEKMLGGQYYAMDAALLLDQDRCALACKNFNRWKADGAPLSDKNLELFLQILCLEQHPNPSLYQPAAWAARLGRDVSVQKPFFCRYGYNISIGDYVEIGPNCDIQDACPVTISEQCSIEANVTIMADSPALDPNWRRLGFKIGKPISIEPGCYIGKGATIMPGCVIGRGSVIHPASVIVTVSHTPFS